MSQVKAIYQSQPHQTTICWGTASAIKSNDLVNSFENHNKQRALMQLRASGLSRRVVHGLEAQYAATLIGKEEEICGAVFGHCGNNKRMVIATTDRIIVVKPGIHSVIAEQIDYESFTNVDVIRQGLGWRMKIRTNQGNIDLHVSNNRAAYNLYNCLQQKLFTM